MRITVVEPHADDAFLSLGWHIEKVWKDYQVTILTVYADARRKREAEQYAKIVGATSLVLELEGSGMNSDTHPTHKAEVDKAIDSTKPNFTVLPIGLQHPDHRSTALQRPKGSILRYLDTPYQSKQKMEEPLRNLTCGKRVYSILFPPKRKWRHAGVFKSQSLFFHYNPLDTLRLPEILLIMETARGYGYQRKTPGG